MIDILSTDAAIRDANNHENMYKRNTGSYSFLYVFPAWWLSSVWAAVTRDFNFDFPINFSKFRKIMRVMIIYIII